jgi:hypothetical protein
LDKSFLSFLVTVHRVEVEVKVEVEVEVKVKAKKALNIRSPRLPQC